jgi:molecular chaperone DnaJ
VPLALAALGAELDVPTLDGRRPLEIPGGTQPGQIFRLKGQGMPVLRRPGRRGDLRVVATSSCAQALARAARAACGLAETTAQGDGERSGESVVGKLRRLLHG